MLKRLRDIRDEAELQSPRPQGAAPSAPEATSASSRPRELQGSSQAAAPSPREVRRGQSVPRTPVLCYGAASPPTQSAPLSVSPTVMKVLKDWCHGHAGMSPGGALQDPWSPRPQPVTRTQPVSGPLSARLGEVEGRPVYPWPVVAQPQEPARGSPPSALPRAALTVNSPGPMPWREEPAQRLWAPPQVSVRPPTAFAQAPGNGFSPALVQLPKQPPWVTPRPPWVPPLGWVSPQPQPPPSLNPSWA